MTNINKEIARHITNGAMGLAIHKSMGDAKLCGQVLESFANRILSDLQLPGLEASYFVSRNINYNLCDLTNSRFTNVFFDSVKFLRCDLSGAVFGNVKFQPYSTFDDSNVTGAIFESSRFHQVVVRHSDFSLTVFKNAEFKDCAFQESKFVGADFSGVDLGDTMLYDCDLSEANFTGADLSMVRMNKCSITLEQLRSADTLRAKQDFQASLAHVQEDIPYLRKALVEGRINGDQYEGDCCCLAGTIANSKGIYYMDLTDVCGFPIDHESPRERWFTNIHEGDTPQTNPYSQITVEWIDEVL